MKLLFVAFNIVVLTVFVLVLLPDRVFILQGQVAALDLKERQLTILEENYLNHEENAALLTYLLAQENYIIQPTGHVGAMLEEIRAILHSHRLSEFEFYASEQGGHYVDGRFVVRTLATFAVDGSYHDVVEFISDLDSHYRFVRLERMQLELMQLDRVPLDRTQLDRAQISGEFSPTRLWLVFSIYEEQ